MQKVVKQRILIVVIFALIMLTAGGLAIASHTQDAAAQQDSVATKTATQTKTACPSRRLDTCGCDQGESL